MAITTTDVTNAAPELLGSARLAWAVSEANSLVNETRLGAAGADRARVYLAAHLLTLKPEGGVASRSAAGVSISYNVGSSAAGSDDLELTAYGRRYKRLLRMHLAVVVG